MSINMQPVDGLIYRILQQHKHSFMAQARGTDASLDADQQRLLSVEKQPLYSVESHLHASTKSSGRSLESHLLSLYKTVHLTGE
ncbi:MAG: hypothetical protein Q9M31_00200 [Mariprofundus sp.]|nr:hypothetical protein [Mariprofundus sp.]